MINTVRIASCFEGEQERTLPILETVYQDGERLRDMIGDLVGMEFLQGLKGKKIFLKPNWVRHSVREGDEVCLRTHDNFVLGVLEVVLKQSVASVVLGDAPIQGCDWKRMHSEAFLSAIDSLATRYETPVLVKDFRRKIFDPERNDGEEECRPLSDYLIFDVGTRSFLEDVTQDGNFRITCYPPERLKKEHQKGRHRYCIIKDLFEADVVLSLPKVKTHQKTGITGALKNFVGVNGDKDYLPHHRIGGTKFGGDCYPGGSFLRRWSEVFSDMANRNQKKSRYRFYQKFSSLFWRLSRPGKVHQRAAGWYGNDTCWRMVMDLNLIIKYGRADGILADVPQREIWSLCDGIIGGQGNGPLEPEPLPLGIVSFTDSGCLNDVRRKIFDPERNDGEEECRPLSDYLIFDVGTRSFLEDVTQDGNFRITCYPPERLKKEHQKGRHRYCIIKDLFEADVVLSLPKVKTHQKTGITGALKNFVGVNGDKDYLPHHRIGGTKFGGDCYPGGSFLRRWSEVFSDMANRNQKKSRYRFYQKFSSLFWRLSRPGKVHQRAAGWYGNDTCWRMVMDLNLIIKYGRADGILADVPQREIWSLCDGIIGGQGNGPLEPEPLPLGIVSFTDSGCLNDVCMGTLMGFDVEKIYLLRSAIEQIKDDENCVYWNGKRISLEDLKTYAVKTKPSPGWEDYLKNV